MKMIVLIILLLIINIINVKGLSLQSTSLKSSLNMKLVTNDISSLSYHVSDLKKSIDFYTKVLGFNTINIKENSVTLNMIENNSNTYLELLQNKQEYDLGDGFIGIGINKNIDDSNKIIQQCSKYGGKVILDIGDFAYGACMIPDEDEMKVTPVRYGRITDPDGYCIEITETKDIVIPSSKIKLNVVDWEESEKFYMEILGMKLLRRRSNINSKPKKASMTSCLGYNSESNGILLELTYPYSTDVLDLGNGYNQLKFTCSDISWTKDKLKAGGYKYDEVTNNSIIVKDPNNYKILLSN